jgi:hypothetical protein
LFAKSYHPNKPGYKIHKLLTLFKCIETEKSAAVKLYIFLPRKDVSIDYNNDDGRPCDLKKKWRTTIAVPLAAPV